MDEATLSKFGKWIDYGKSHLRGKKFPPKRAWSESRDRFGMKPRSLNFANASTMASATPAVKNCHPETGMFIYLLTYLLTYVPSLTRSQFPVSYKYPNSQRQKDSPRYVDFTDRALIALRVTITQISTTRHYCTLNISVP